MGVQFEEDDITRVFVSEQTPKLAAWLIKKGLARNLSGANRLQVIVAIICFALAIYFAF